MNRLSKRLTYLLISLSLSLHGLVAAEPESVDLNFGPDLPSAGWQIVSFPFISALTFKVVDTTTVEIVADAAAGMAWHTVSESASSVVSAAWGWRAYDGVGPTDLTKKGSDDRIAAVYFVFGEEADRSKSIMSLLASPTVHALVYVFGGDKPRWAIVDSPHMGSRGRFIILQAADAQRHQWMEERVNLQADYARAFGGTPGKLLGVAISSDSDDTHGTNRIRIRALRVSR